MRPPTLMDIARRCDLSKATVSLAMRNAPGVAPATVARVRAVAREIGYRSNPFLGSYLSAIRRREGPKSAAIAYLQYFDSPSNARFLHGVRDQCDKYEYACDLLMPARDALSPSRIVSILDHRGIHGAIIGPMDRPGCTVDFDFSRLAVVTIGHSLGGPDIHRAATDFPGAMDRLLVELAARGYKRPGFVETANAFVRTGMHLAYRFLGWQHFNGGENPVPPLIEDKPDARDVQAWLVRHEPDVVISGVSGIGDWLREGGRRIPEDIAWCSPAIYSSDPIDIAGMQEDQEAVAAAAVDLLVGTLFRNEFGIPAQTRLTLVAAAWQEGTTLRSRT